MNMVVGVMLDNMRTINMLSHWYGNVLLNADEKLKKQKNPIMIVYVYIVELDFRNKRHAPSINDM